MYAACKFQRQSFAFCFCLSRFFCQCVCAFFLSLIFHTLLWFPRSPEVWLGIFSLFVSSLHCRQCLFVVLFNETLYLVLTRVSIPNTLELWKSLTYILAEYPACEWSRIDAQQVAVAIDGIWSMDRIVFASKSVCYIQYCFLFTLHEICWYVERHIQAFLLRACNEWNAE